MQFFYYYLQQAIFIIILSIKENSLSAEVSSGNQELAKAKSVSFQNQPADASGEQNKKTGEKGWANWIWVKNMTEKQKLGEKFVICFIENEVQALKEEIDNLNSYLQNQKDQAKVIESKLTDDDKNDINQEEKEKLIAQLQEANSKLANNCFSQGHRA